MLYSLRKLWLLSALLLFQAGLVAQNVELNQAIPLDPKVKVGQLENGIRYYIRQNPKPEKKVELRLAINAGSMQEDPDQLGLAHFTEHMLFNGTKNFKKNDIVSYLQSVGVKFGADLNAYTSFDETVYILPIPSDNPQILEQGFQILEDWAHQATFEGEEIEKERGVVIEEWRTGRGADQRMRDEFFPVLFKGSRYAERLPIGTKETLESFPHETIKRFYRDWYRPDLMAVVVVGDIDVNEMEQKIKAHFGKIAPTKNPRKKELYPIPDHSETLVSITTDPEAPFTQIGLYHKRPKIEVKTQADYRQNLVHELYAQMLNARFDELGQSAEPPFVYAYGYYGDLLRTKDAYVTAANVSETGIMPGLKAILTENRRLMQHGFTDTELERAKKEILKSYENRYNERNKTESGDIVDGYVYNFLTGSPQPGIEWEYAFVKNVLDGIVLNEVNVLPKQWIKPENRVLVIMAPEKEGVKIPSEAEVRQLLAEVEKMETTAYQDKVISEPLMSQVPAPGQIVSEKSLDAVGSTEILLSNGVKVILKPTDFKDDEILMTAFSPGGHSLVADADYYSALSASDIITESGIRMFSYTDLQKLLTGKTVQVSPYISDLAEGLRGSTSPKDLETMFQLTHLYFTEPRKDETAFKSFIAKQKGFLGNLMKSPQFAFYDKQIRLMNQNHPRGGGFPQPEDFDKINLDRAFQIYQERFANAGDFTFILVGNFDKEAIKPFLTTYLASLPTLGRQESFRDLGVRPPQGKVEESFEMGKDPKSQVMIAFAGTLKDDRERYLMQSLAEALTIKLIENLREEKGGVYGTRASASTALFPYRSYSLSVNFTCAPENVQTLMDAVYEEIAKVQKNGPTPEDLNKVKESQRKDVEKNEKENQFWLNGLRRAYYEGFEADRLTSARQMERINALTAKDLQKVAKKYLSLKTPITLVMAPEKAAQTTSAPEKTSDQGAETNTPVDVASLTPEAVVNRYLEALGGREKLEKITTLRRVASTEVMGMQMELEEIDQSPNLSFKKQSMMGQVMVTMVFNGEKSLITNPQGKQILEGEQANALNEGGIFPALNWLNNPEYKLSLEGEAEVNGEKAIKLRVQSGDSDEETIYYYSLATGLEIREETKSPQGTAYVNITAYEEIEGIKFIKEMQSEQMGMAFKVIYQTTELNPKVEEGIFKIE